MSLQPAGEAIPGKPLEINASISTESGPVTGTHVFRVTVTDPNEQDPPWYTQNVLALEGRATITIPLALNEMPGAYTVRAKDVMSGITGTATFRL